MSETNLSQTTLPPSPRYVVLENDDTESQADAHSVGQNLLTQVEHAEPSGRLIMDMPWLLAGSKDEDAIAREGEQLFISSTRQEVTIMAEVGFPALHLLNPQLSVADYIGLGGGFTQRSDAGRTCIIKANGRVVSCNRSTSFFEKGPRLEAGDSIEVPSDVEAINYLVTWSSVSRILFNLATSVLSISSVQKSA